MPAETPVRLPLVTVPSNRLSDANKDSKLVNCYAQKSETEEYWIYKRAGLLTYQSQTGAGEGTWNWLGDIYSVFGTTLYKNGVAIAGAVDGTNGIYAFSQCQGATPKLILGNGVKAYTYDAVNGIVQITNVNFPATFTKGWAYLDGTTYVMDSKANIYGSGINDPQTWTALNLINANSDTGSGVSVQRQLAYVVAFKQWNTEVFYDAANATGSPLSAAANAMVTWGCANATSIQDADGVLYWIAINRSSELQIMAMENLSAKPVSTKAVERLLDVVDYSLVYSWYLRDMGYRFYGITFPNSNLTLVYDISEGLWHQWTDVNGNYFPMISAVAAPNLKHLFQHDTNGKLYYADLAYYNDDGSAITVDIVTPNFEGENRRRKMVSKLEVLAVQQAGSTLQIRKSDDDYQTWSSYRSVDLSLKHPKLLNCGTFTKRAYNLRHQSNTPLRIRAIELQIDEGTL